MTQEDHHNVWSQAVGEVSKSCMGVAGVNNG